TFLRTGVPEITFNFQGTTNISAGDGTGKSRVMVTSNMAQIVTFQSVDQNGVASADVHNLLLNAPLVVRIPNANSTFVNNNLAITTSSPQPDPLSGINPLAAVTILAPNGSMTLAGNPAPITVTGGGNPTILIQSRGPNSFVNISSSYTFNAGPTGEVVFRKLNILNNDPTGSINLADASTLTASGGSGLRFIAPLLNLGANSSVITSGGAISILSSTNAAAPLTIMLPDSSYATMLTGGGAITFMPTSGVGNFGNGNALATTFAPDQPINFTGCGPLNLLGGAVTTTTANTSTNNGTTTVSADVTLSSDNSI